MSEQVVSVTEGGVLRCVRSEARQDERTRILDELRVATDRADREAAATRSDKPALTAPGRRAAGLRAAIELVEQVAPNDVGEQWAAVGSYDSVELHWYDPAGERDELPVRLVCNDNAEAVTACAYLSIDEAEQLFADGLGLVDKLRRERAEPAAEAVTGEP